MRKDAKLLIAMGAVDLLIAMGAVLLYSVAWSSQYTGLLAWVLSRTPGIETGSPQYEEIRTHILSVLDRTTWQFFVVTAALALSGFVLMVAGVRARKASAGHIETARA